MLFLYYVWFCGHIHCYSLFDIFLWNTNNVPRVTLTAKRTFTRRTLLIMIWLPLLGFCFKTSCSKCSTGINSEMDVLDLKLTKLQITKKNILAAASWKRSVRFFPIIRISISAFSRATAYGVSPDRTHSQGVELIRLLLRKAVAIWVPYESPVLI